MCVVPGMCDSVCKVFHRAGYVVPALIYHVVGEELIDGGEGEASHMTCHIFGPDHVKKWHQKLDGVEFFEVRNVAQ